LLSLIPKAGSVVKETKQKVIPQASHSNSMAVDSGNFSHVPPHATNKNMVSVLHN